MNTTYPKQIETHVGGRNRPRPAHVPGRCVCGPLKGGHPPPSVLPARPGREKQPTAHVQKLLPFDGDRETKRQERCRRILSELPEHLRGKVRTFDDAAYREATALAQAAEAEANGQ